MSVPYSHDFHSNQIGVAVAFDETKKKLDETKHSFYKYYYKNDTKNEWVLRTAYNPVGISEEFKSKDIIKDPYHKDGEIQHCLAISANIGNAHRTGNYEIDFVKFFF